MYFWSFPACDDTRDFFLLSTRTLISEHAVLETGPSFDNFLYLSPLLL